MDYSRAVRYVFLPTDASFLLTYPAFLVFDPNPRLLAAILSRTILVMTAGRSILGSHTYAWCIPVTKR